jgi:hypothetical protein
MEMLESDEEVILDESIFFNRAWLMQARLEIKKLYDTRDLMPISEIQ